MTGKPETVSEYLASLVVAMLKAIKRQVISDGVIRTEEMHFAGPVPDEGDNPKELEGKWRVDGTWIDPKLLIAGRKEEMEYMMKMGVFEVVDEKECYDNGCKPLMLKWVDKMKGEKCRLKMLVSTMMTGHDDENHVDGPLEMATWDVSRGHFHVEVRRWIHTFLPEGHEQIGKLARLCRSMYGTRDAASFWGDTWSRCAERRDDVGGRHETC